MSTQTIVIADGTSKVSQYLDYLIIDRDRLLLAAHRDAYAVEILSSPMPLVTALNRVGRAHWSNHRNHREPRVWTRRDERRLNWIRGVGVDHWCPPCRLARTIRKTEQQHSEVYRAALDETRQDNTAGFVGPLLLAAKNAHEDLISEARDLTERETLPLSREFNSEEAHHRAVAELMGHAPRPKVTKPNENNTTWITVTEAAREQGATKPEITRAANKGEIRTNGKTGRERRIDAASLVEWSLRRAAQ